MMEQHTWTRVAHDGPDAGALFGPIAMIAAALARRLGIHPAATARAQDRISLK